MKKDIIKRISLERKRRRVRAKVQGTSERPRLSVYRSEKHIYGQLIDDISGVTLVSASSIAKDLKAKVDELDPISTAKAIGEALAEKAMAAGINKVVFDRGGRRYIGRVQALAEGARSKGLQF
jgi:large subunit ribosomal protein L18